MGVPAFFKWLSARYPLIMQRIYEEEGASFDSCHVFDEHGSIVPQKVDNLYLDCNGIVHPCCHPEGGRKQPENEEEMFLNIHALIDRLFNLTRPRNLLYLALDGVAPRAKMNQQRTRRFCSAREFEEQEEAMKQFGINPSSSSSWDHNQITPGTPFMARLAISLRNYVTEKQRVDKAWQNIVVIIDDSSNPGEGEHKIMDYIRRWRHSPNYNPNITHAICGQDADLIHLGLALHEPNVLILRERVEIQNKKGYVKKQNRKMMKPATSSSSSSSLKEELINETVHESINIEKNDRTGMDFLSIERLRQYLFYEFYKSFQTEEMILLSTIHNIQFIFNIENIIDDFIFICFFVGNDFLPHLPSLSIRDGSLDLLLKLYSLILPQLKGYINNEGYINLSRVEILISKFGLLESNILKKKAMDDERRNRRDQYRSQSRQTSAKNNPKTNQSPGSQALEEDGGGGVEESELKLKFDMLVLEKNEQLAAQCQQTLLDVEGPDYKAQYYKQKILNDERNSEEHDKEDDINDEEDKQLANSDVCSSARGCTGGGDSGFVTVVTSKMRRQNKKKEFQIKLDQLIANMRKEYMKGLCWVALYYAQGVPSWTWFYPYHYAPFASDLCQLMSLHPIQFDIGKPFSPLTQLMAVLPARSAHCVPPAYRPLMENAGSSLAANYNLEFELDPNNKPASMRWLWVAKIPFLDTELLLKELSKLNSQLSNEEKIRNSFHEIEILFSHHHPLSRFIHNKVNGKRIEKDNNQKEEENEKSWVKLMGHDIDGFVHIPKLLNNDATAPTTPTTTAAAALSSSSSSSNHIYRYHYRFSQSQVNKSIVHDYFMVQAPPLIWSVLQFSLPRKEPKLPISQNQLDYIVYYDPTTSLSSFEEHATEHWNSGPNLMEYRQQTDQNGGNNYRGRRNQGVKTELCRFINTPKGCTWGANCRFSHSV